MSIPIAPRKHRRLIAAAMAVPIALSAAVAMADSGVQQISPSPAVPSANPQTTAPTRTAAVTIAHPLNGYTLSLSGALALGGDDPHPTVWVKATDGYGQSSLYSTVQLESLGYQVAMPEAGEVVLTYGQVRLLVRGAAAQ